MWSRLTGKGDSSSSVSAKDSADEARRRRTSESTRSKRDRDPDSRSVVSSTSTRKPSRRDTAPSSIASFATAFDEMPRARANNDLYEDPRDERSPRQRDDRPASYAASSATTTRRDRSRSRERDEKDRKKATVKAKDGKWEKRRSSTRSERSGSASQVGGYRGDILESPNPVTRTFSGQIGSEGFSQFPGQAGAPIMSGALPLGSQPPHGMSSHVQDQFPGQDPVKFASSALPGGNPFGAAADFYLDQGQSVHQQPGIRPQPPSVIIGQDTPHLMSAAVQANPVADTGSGAAADFYGNSGPPTSKPSKSSRPSSSSMPGAFIDDGPAPQRPPRPTKLTKPTKPEKPSKFGSAATLAGGAALGYAMGNGSPSTQQHSNSYSASNVHQSSSYTNGAPTTSSSTYYQGQPLSNTAHDSNNYPPPYSGSMDGAPPPKPPRPGKSEKQPSGSNAGLYAAGAAGLAAYGLHQHNSHSNSNSNSHQHLHNHSSTLGAYPGQHYNGLDPSPSPFGAGSMTQRHQHTGPVSKFVDWWKDYEDVQKMEEYTEYIGVCKGCFDPRSSVMDAPRKHHFHKRRSNEYMRPSGGIEKQSRYSLKEKKSQSSFSSGDERRKKNSTSAAGWVAAGLGGIGLAKAGKAVFSGGRDDFDDTYSIKSGRDSRSRISRQSRSRSQDRKSYSYGHGEVRRRSRSHDRMSQMSVGVTKDKKDYKVVRRHSRSRSRSSSGSRKGRSSFFGTAIGAGLAGAALGAAASKKQTKSSRSRSPKKVRVQHQRRDSSDDERRRRRSQQLRRKSSRSSASGASVIEIGQDTQSQGGFLGGFFAAPPPKEKRYKSTSHQKKKKGFFNFGNGSSSSSDSEMAFGTGYVRRRQRASPKRRSSEERLKATLAGLGATAAAIAAAKAGKATSKRHSEVVAVKEHRYGRKSNDRHRPASRYGDDEWEDLPDDDTSVSSGNGGLVYGDYDWKKGKSQESLVSNGSGTSKWGWRWGFGKKKKQSSDNLYDNIANTALIGPVTAGAAGALTGTAIGSQLGRHDSESSSVQTLQSVYPVAPNDPTALFDARRTSLVQTPQPLITSGPGSINLQQPQPMHQVPGAIYSTQASSQVSFVAPAGPPVFSQASYQAPYPTQFQTQNVIVQTPQLPGNPPLPRRANSSPIQSSSWKRDAAIAGLAATAGAAAFAAAKANDRPASDVSNVRFNLTQEQVAKEQRERRREQDRRDEEETRRRDLQRREDDARREEEERVRREQQRREDDVRREEAERVSRDQKRREEEERVQRDQQRRDDETRRLEEDRHREQLRREQETLLEEQERRRLELQRQQEEAIKYRDAERLAKSEADRQLEERRRQQEEMRARETREAEELERQQRDARIEAQRKQDLEAEIVQTRRERRETERREAEELERQQRDARIEAQRKQDLEAEVVQTRRERRETERRETERIEAARRDAEIREDAERRRREREAQDYSDGYSSGRDRRPLEPQPTGSSVSSVATDVRRKEKELQDRERDLVEPDSWKSTAAGAVAAGAAAAITSAAISSYKDKDKKKDRREERKRDSSSSSKTSEPSKAKTVEPSKAKSVASSKVKAVESSKVKTVEPSKTKTVAPSQVKTVEPSNAKTVAPSQVKTIEPSQVKTIEPSKVVTYEPSRIAQDYFDDEVFDPNLFKKKQSVQDVYQDWEERYNEKPVTQAEFFAPKELLENDNLPKVHPVDPNEGITDLHVYQAHEDFGPVPPMAPPYPASYAFTATRDGRPSTQQTWPVPSLNLIQPTPPGSRAPSVRSMSMPPSPAIKPVHEVEEEPMPEETNRARSRVSWGENQFHHFEVATPDSYRDQFISDSDLKNQEKTVEPASSAWGESVSSYQPYRPAETSQVSEPKETAPSTQFIRDEDDSSWDSIVSASAKKSRKKEKKGKVAAAIATTAAGVTAAALLARDEEDERNYRRDTTSVISNPFSDTHRAPSTIAASTVGSSAASTIASSAASENTVIYSPQYQTPQYQAPQQQKPQYQAPQYQTPQSQRIPESDSRKATDQRTQVPSTVPREVATESAPMHVPGSFDEVTSYEVSTREEAKTAPKEEDRGKKSKSTDEIVVTQDTPKRGRLEPAFVPEPVKEITSEPETKQSKKDKKKKSKAAKRMSVDSWEESDVSPLGSPTVERDIRDMEPQRSPEIARQSVLAKDTPTYGENSSNKTATAAMAGGFAALVGAAMTQDQARMSSDLERARQSLESAEKHIARDVPSSPTNGTRTIDDAEKGTVIPSTAFQDVEELADVKTPKRKKEKRHSSGKWSPTIGSPLRTETKYDDYMGARRRPSLPEQQPLVEAPKVPTEFPFTTAPQPTISRDVYDSGYYAPDDLPRKDPAERDSDEFFSASSEEREKAKSEALAAEKVDENKTKSRSTYDNTDLKPQSKHEDDDLKSRSKYDDDDLKSRSTNDDEDSKSRSRYDDEDTRLHSKYDDDDMRSVVSSSSKYDDPEREERRRRRREAKSVSREPSHDRGYDLEVDSERKRRHRRHDTDERADDWDTRSTISDARSDATGERRRKHKKRDGERDGSPESKTRSRSSATSEPGDAYEDRKSSKRRSRRDGDDDNASVISSSSRYDEDRSSKKEKEKEKEKRSSGLFGLFSKSKENLADTPSKYSKTKDDDDEERKHRRRKHRSDRGSTYGGSDDDDMRSTISSSSRREKRSSRSERGEGERRESYDDKVHRSSYVR